MTEGKGWPAQSVGVEVEGAVDLVDLVSAELRVRPMDMGTGFGTRYKRTGL